MINQCLQKLLLTDRGKLTYRLLLLLLLPFYSHYTGQPVLAGGFCWSKVLLPHALDDGN